MLRSRMNVLKKLAPSAKILIELSVYGFQVELSLRALSALDSILPHLLHSRISAYRVQVPWEQILSLKEILPRSPSII